MTHTDAGPTGANGPDDDTDDTHNQDDGLVDEMVDESFPGSDPPSTWAGPDTPGPN